MNRLQKGFAVTEMILILIAVGIIAFVAWRIVDANGAVEQAASGVPKSSEVQTPKAAVTPTKSSDLDTLSKQMDNTSVDDSSTTDLDSQSTFQ